MNALNNNPFMRPPDHPNYNRRAAHHDYHRPARYLITILKNPAIKPFSRIEGNFRVTEGNESPHPTISPTGAFIIEGIKLWLQRYRQIELADFVVMPDHLHLCIDVKFPLPNGLSLAISWLKGKISSLRHNALPEHLRSGEMMPVFAKGFNDRIAYDARQWEKQIRYIADNPRRYLLKKSVPDFMLRKWHLEIGDRQLTAKGNIFLLKNPEIFVVKHSRKWSETESEEYQRSCRLKIDNGAIPVSPFIHPKEKAIRDFAIEEGGCYIRICDNGFAERESATGFEVDLMATGRLLLVAPTGHDTRKHEMKYAYAQELNALAAQLVAIAGTPGILRVCRE